MSELAAVIGVFFIIFIIGAIAILQEFKKINSYLARIANALENKYEDGDGGEKMEVSVGDFLKRQEEDPGRKVVQISDYARRRKK